MDVNRLSPSDIRGEKADHVAYHAPRWAFLLGLVERYLPDSNHRVLDIGRSEFTELMRAVFRIKVDSLGLGPDHSSGDGDHYHFDLNSSQNSSQRRKDLPTYDIIVMGEVIEHLHTSPKLVLSFLKSLLNPGGILILTTANAAALGKRLGLLIGRNPYDLIAENDQDPDHFREYTMDELERYAAASGFAVEEKTFSHYQDYRFRVDRPKARLWAGTLLGRKFFGTLMNWTYALVPRGLKPCLCIVIRKGTQDRQLCDETSKI